MTLAFSDGSTYNDAISYHMDLAGLFPNLGHGDEPPKDQAKKPLPTHPSDEPLPKPKEKSEGIHSLNIDQEHHVPLLASAIMGEDGNMTGLAIDHRVKLDDDQKELLHLHEATELPYMHDLMKGGMSASEAYGVAHKHATDRETAASIAKWGPEGHELYKEGMRAAVSIAKEASDKPRHPLAHTTVHRLDEEHGVFNPNDIKFGGIEFGPEFEMAKRLQQAYDEQMPGKDTFTRGETYKYGDQPTERQQFKTRQTGHEEASDLAQKQRQMEYEQVLKDTQDKLRQIMKSSKPKSVKEPLEMHDTYPGGEVRLESGQKYAMADEPHKPLPIDILQGLPGVHAGPGVGRFARPANMNKPIKQIETDPALEAQIQKEWNDMVRTGKVKEDPYDAAVKRQKAKETGEIVPETDERVVKSINKGYESVPIKTWEKLRAEWVKKKEERGKKNEP